MSANHICPQEGHQTIVHYRFRLAEVRREIQALTEEIQTQLDAVRSVLGCNMHATCSENVSQYQIVAA